VLGSLRADWRQFAAPHIGDLTLDLSLDPVIVTHLSGASEVTRLVLHERPTPDGSRAPVAVTVGGFVGTVTYTLDGPDDPAAVASLFALARYSGVGAHTTRGFGGLRLPDPPGR
jgi:CRISPR/Cas system endoribonuclease Cas6 (RAMP superfamily)